jgi:pyruvate,water dikinase
MTAAVLWLDEIREGDRERVGGKAFALARLKQRGLRVPDGFVLPAEAPVEAALAGYARLGGRVAVRSSSSAEDLKDASFAGQYETILDVGGEEALRAAIRACRDSAPAASAYARALGAGPGTLAVLVQRMLAPRAAGVAFTRHPTEEGRLIVESHAGLGEAVVSGAVTPDRYVLDRTTGARIEGPAEKSLSARDLEAVQALALAAESEQGGPQDVEWAIVGGEAMLLQSRPITVEPDETPDPRLHRLTRANVGEVLPDPVTPLTWSTVGDFLEHGFRSVAAAAGLLPAEAGPFLALHRRRLYLNLSLSVEIAGRLPGVSRAHAEALLLGRASPGGSPPPASSPVALGVAVRLWRLARGLPAEVAEAERRVESLAPAPVVAVADAPALGVLFDRFRAAGRAVARAHIAVSGACGLRLALLARLLDTLRPGETAERINRLVAGLPDLPSVAPALALESLAREAAAEPAWGEWLFSGEADTAEAPAALGARLQQFLHRFGHRAVAEGELAAAAWEDDPRPVLEALRALARSDADAALRRRAAADTRAADEDALLSAVGPLRRAVLRRALAAARDAVSERERTKELSVRLVHHGRRLARAAGRRLAEARRLADADEVFLLSADELGAALRGLVPPRARLERRRRRQEREGRLPAPREVDLRQPAEDAEASGSQHGTPVSSGIGLGPARVLGEGAALRMEPGEVLVAPVLDAAYGPLLAASAGAVAEIGGLLSHGAVVARELGIPCVVDVREATRTFATGERVLVDGSRGLVSRAPEAEATSGSPAPALREEDPARESRHALEAHRDARESVYLNVQDPQTGLVLVASVGVRRGDRGESLIALRVGEGPVLFAIQLAPAAPGPRIEVGDVCVEWHPFRYRFAGRLAAHETAGFPPAPGPLLLAPRTVSVRLDLVFEPTTPAIDFSRSLSEEEQKAVVPLGAHHVEQSGLWRGSLQIDGRRLAVRGTGSRDHSWGRRSWDAADHWRLFTARLAPRGRKDEDELAIHALSFAVYGRKIEGGFLARGGRAERLTRVTYAPESDSAFDLRLATESGETVRLRGAIETTLVVPVDVDRRLLSHLAGRPYRLLLREGFTRYEGAGHEGRGLAELTVRPW